MALNSMMNTSTHDRMSSSRVWWRGKKSSAHWGDNYKTIPPLEGRRVYSNIKVEGDARTHAGNNYEYDERPSLG
jgi:4-alpha-glucanotransferase